MILFLSVSRCFKYVTIESQITHSGYVQRKINANKDLKTATVHPRFNEKLHSFCVSVDYAVRGDKGGNTEPVFFLLALKRERIRGQSTPRMPIDSSPAALGGTRDARSTA
ncbi:hypothetical protein ALC60_02653 [Trachymyrmex zeteki]|uniref:Uncharacterized protein n=1 Tax=Mycetomoellerius zeteki TaxID=64791 RepID=A0A151XD04_9HYME|nr:hypothetical protein ALC60_02653 [Trachymyrmex zeteki]